MSLERWHPLRDLEQMRRDMDSIWEEIFPAGRLKRDSVVRRAPLGNVVPPIDVIDTGKELLVRAELPGVKKEDLELSFQDNTLSIKGEVKETTAYRDDEYRYSERSAKSYSRTIGIDQKIDADKISADLKDGLLSVRLPKSEQVLPKKIKVDVG